MRSAVRNYLTYASVDFSSSQTPFLKSVSSTLLPLFISTPSVSFSFAVFGRLFSFSLVSLFETTNSRLDLPTKTTSLTPTQTFTAESPRITAPNERARAPTPEHQGLLPNQTPHSCLQPAARRDASHGMASHSRSMSISRSHSSQAGACGGGRQQQFSVFVFK
jgi:hypothetical protein